jgi:membrane protein implicated in regulation of membrane protease activity
MLNHVLHNRGLGLLCALCVGLGFFLFGFALRCVALLCGVFVRLHCVLFPASGPFLPSLSITLYYITRFLLRSTSQHVYRYFLETLS